MPWRFVIVLLLALAATAGWWLCQQLPGLGRVPKTPPTLQPAPASNQGTEVLGKKIANLAFTGADSKTTPLYGFKDKAIVLVFLSFECPVSTSYLQPLADLANEFGKRGVAFVGLMANQDETPADMAQHVKEFKVPFPVFLDSKLAAANAVAATHTPEVFVLDAGYALHYRGRIDDAFHARLKRNQMVTQHDLRNALEELLSGRPVSTPMTSPIGCPIYRAPASQTITQGTTDSKERGAVTYHKDIVPILQTHCQECHRQGAVAPFALTTYTQAVNWAADIKNFTQSGRMPPWKICDGLPFENERRLSDQDIATLAAWADNGTPEGDAKSMGPTGPLQPKGPIGTQAWKHGSPDLVLAVPDDYQVGPTGSDVFRCFVLPTQLTEDKFVQTIEVKPGNPRLVHHALLFIDTAGKGRELENLQQKVVFKDPYGGNPLDNGPGYYGGMGIGFLPASNLGGWAPGQLPRTLPDGTGILLPRGSDIVLQMHYHRNGRLEKDKTSVGLYWSTKKVERTYQGEVLTGLFQSIPAGNERFVVKGASTVTEDMVLYDLMPHMHMVGKEIKVSMTRPGTPASGGGGKAVLLYIKDWDFNWQETHVLKEPLLLKAGTRLDLEAVYDNSARNPNNPFRPPRLVTYGEQTFNEMCNVYLGGTSNRKGTWLPLEQSLDK